MNIWLEQAIFWGGLGILLYIKKHSTIPKKKHLGISWLESGLCKNCLSEIDDVRIINDGQDIHWCKQCNYVEPMYTKKNGRTTNNLTGHTWYSNMPYIPNPINVISPWAVKNES